MLPAELLPRLARVAKQRIGFGGPEIARIDLDEHAAVACIDPLFSDARTPPLDLSADTAEGLFSYPRRFGIHGALVIARGFHVLMLACLLALAWSLGLGTLSLAGIAAVAALLAYEHSLVKPHDLSRVNAAFFTMNGYVSVLFFLFWAADILFVRKAI